MYDPLTPDYTIMLDDLPGNPRIDENGQIQARSAAAITCMFIPAASVIGHSYWIFHILTH